MSPAKPRKSKTEAKIEKKPNLVLVFNTARFPVQFDAEQRSVPPQSTQVVELNEYVQRAIDKGLFAVRS